jgi:N-acetylneuraminate synthase
MEIGPKPFVIGELSGNHSGELNKMLNLIINAALAGCDAIKFQLYKPDDMGDPTNDHLYEECRVPVKWLPQMFSVAEDHGTPLFASVFAPWAIEELENHDCPAYKLASPESTRLPRGTYEQLINRIKQTGKPSIASTGGGDRVSIRSLKPDYLLYCVSGYPATVTDEDIAFMRGFNFDGFSDHSGDIKTPLAMIAAGARIIEKHFKLDNNCVDAAFSLDPIQMKLLCDIAHR